MGFIQLEYFFIPTFILGRDDRRDAFGIERIDIGLSLTRAAGYLVADLDPGEGIGAWLVTRCTHLDNQTQTITTTSSKVTFAQ